MGQRGPKLLSAKTKRLHGSWRGNYQQPEPVPVGDGKMPVCPEWLSEAARAKWFELIPQLQAVSEGLLSSVDVHILARYCTLWVLWQKARGFIEKHGETVVDIRGHAKLRPEVSLLLRYARELLRIEAEFGMTPKDRARLTGRQKPEPKSGKARFFRLPIQGKPDL